MADHGEAGLSAFRNAYPELSTSSYDPARFDAEQVVEDADLVIVHEWTDPAIVAALGALRKRRGAMTLLFHDTHHRMVSDPEAMSRFDLRSEENTSELQSLMRISYAVFCLKKKKKKNILTNTN